MSDPYNQYSPQYPSGQYPVTGSNYPQQGNDQGYQSQGYQQPDYPPQQSAYDAPPGGFGPLKRADSYGPPQAGGFQHGQAGGQFGAYDASNPQGHAGYYGDYSGPPAPYGQQQQQYPPQQHYDPNNPQQQHYDPNNPHQQPPYGDNRDPNAPPGSQGPQGNFDPNAPEGERGLGSSLLGGAAGYYMGHKKNHGLIGAIGGAIAGNFLGDKMKDKKHHHHSGHSSHSGSSWGGSRW